MSTSFSQARPRPCYLPEPRSIGHDNRVVHFRRCHRNGKAQPLIAFNMHGAQVLVNPPVSCANTNYLFLPRYLETFTCPCHRLSPFGPSPSRDGCNVTVSAAELHMFVAPHG